MAQIGGQQNRVDEVDNSNFEPSCDRDVRRNKRTNADGPGSSHNNQGSSSCSRKSGNDDTSSGVVKMSDEEQHVSISSSLQVNSNGNSNSNIRQQKVAQQKTGGSVENKGNPSKSMVQMQKHPGENEEATINDGLAVNVVTILPNSNSSNPKSPKTSRVFDPSGALCYHWSMVVSFAFLYNFWSLSYRFAFREIDFDTVAFWFTLDYSADLIYILDVMINFHTGYLEDGVLQRNIDKIGQHYRECTLFYLDCFCLLPLDILYLSIGFNSILRCTRLVKIYKFWSYADRTERHTNYPNVFRTVTLVHYILVIFHWNACLFHMISKNKILDIENLYKVYDNRCEDILCQYLHAFYWSTLALTTIGDLPKPRTKGEYFYVTLELFFGLFLFASVLGHVANIVTNVSAARKEFQAKLDAVKTFMRMRRVSDDLQNKVIRWFDYLWVSQKSSDEERSVACLPDRLKAEIAIHVHLDTLKRVDIFQNTEAGFLCELVLRLKPVLFSPGDYVCRKNEVGHEMYIVSKGILEVVTDGGKSVVATLKAGSYFGEISVLNDLWDVLKNYPNAEARIRARAEERLSKLDINHNQQQQQQFPPPNPTAMGPITCSRLEQPSGGGGGGHIPTSRWMHCYACTTTSGGTQFVSQAATHRRRVCSSGSRYRSQANRRHQLNQIVPENYHYHPHSQPPPPQVATDYCSPLTSRCCTIAAATHRAAHQIHRHHQHQHAWTTNTANNSDNDLGGGQQVNGGGGGSSLRETRGAPRESGDYPSLASVPDNKKVSPSDVQRPQVADQNVVNTKGRDHVITMPLESTLITQSGLQLARDEISPARADGAEFESEPESLEAAAGGRSGPIDSFDHTRDSNPLESRLATQEAATVASSSLCRRQRKLQQQKQQPSAVSHLPPGARLSSGSINDDGSYLSNYRWPDDLATDVPELERPRRLKGRDNFCSCQHSMELGESAATHMTNNNNNCQLENSRARRRRRCQMTCRLAAHQQPQHQHQHHHHQQQQQQQRDCSTCRATGYLSDPSRSPSQQREHHSMLQQQCPTTALYQAGPALWVQTSNSPAVATATSGQQQMATQYIQVPLVTPLVSPFTGDTSGGAAKDPNVPTTCYQLLHPIQINPTRGLQSVSMSRLDVTNQHNPQHPSNSRLNVQLPVAQSPSLLILGTTELSLPNNTHTPDPIWQQVRKESDSQNNKEPERPTTSCETSLENGDRATTTQSQDY